MKAEITPAGAEVVLIATMLEALGSLAQIRVAMRQAEHTGTDVELATVPVRPLRVVIDEAADMIALGELAGDGTVQQLAGYSLNAIRQIVRTAREQDAAPGSQATLAH